MAICLPSDVVPDRRVVIADWTRDVRSPASATVMNVRLSSHGCVLVPVTTSYTGIAQVALVPAVFSCVLVTTAGDRWLAWSFCAGAAAPPAEDIAVCE